MKTFTADRAKQIKTVAIVNEDPTEKLIRELRSENERLKKMLEKGAMDVPIQPGMSEEGIKKLFNTIYVSLNMQGVSQGREKKTLNNF